MTPIQSRPGKRTFVVALCFTIAFLVPGVITLVKNGDYRLLLIVAGVMSVVFLNLSQIRFECTEEELSYKSLFKRKKIPLEEIEGVRIGPVGAGQRAPKFNVQTRTRGEVVIEVRVLPLPDVQRLAKFLQEEGVPFSVEPDGMSQSMARQVLGGA